MCKVTNHGLKKKTKKTRHNKHMGALREVRNLESKMLALNRLITAGMLAMPQKRSPLAFDIWYLIFSLASHRNRIKEQNIMI